MRKNTQLVLCAALAISLGATACASRRTTADTGAPTTTAGGQTTTAQTSPRTDTTQDVGATAQPGEHTKAEQEERINNAINAFQEIMTSSPDKGIPQDLLDRAQCVVIVPGMKKGALVVGAQYGKGYFSCRSQGGQGWTAPATVRMEGGSVGFQIGGQETDVVMLVMNKQGQDRLLSNQFKLGADASVAAGPVGRTASAGTDAYMTAQMLSWSRSRGVFAGVSLEGVTVREDIGENGGLYGRQLSNRDIIEGNVQPPAGAAQQFIAMLGKHSPRQSS